MLEHSPPLPLSIDYFDLQADRDVAEEEEGIILALKQRNRVRRVRLHMPVPNLRKIVRVIEEEYPVLECLIITRPADEAMASILPETLQAPHLCHLVLKGFSFPIGSRLFMTAAGIAAFYLLMDHQSAYIEPHTLLEWLSFMPQLETLQIEYSVFNFSEVESQLMHTPIKTHANLRWFDFHGPSSYMEALVRRITAPRLERLLIQLLQSSLSVPSLLQFMNATENLRFDSATFRFFGDHVSATVYLRERPKTFALLVSIVGWDLDVQVTDMAQMFNSLSQRLSTVEHLTLTLKHDEEIEFDRANWRRTEWRNLLRSFGKVKTLLVEEVLIELVSDCLQADDEDPSLELLPELGKLTYSARGLTGGAFRSFVDARKNAGRPVTLIYSRSSS